MKKVSIVMCTYNGEKYLQEQIDSLVNQTYPIHELIIQDDCSTDDTMAIAKRYEVQYPFIHVFQNEKQKGVNNNFFSAMQRTTGDFIAISDQDDIWRPDKIEQQMAYANDFLLVVGLSQPFSSDGKVPIHVDKRVPNVGLERIIFSGGLPGHNMLLNKKLLQQIPNLRYWSDRFVYDHLMALVAATYESIYYIPRVLVDHRRHLQAATYTTPLNFEKTWANLFSTINRTFLQYFRVHKSVARYFSDIYNLLNVIPVQNSSKKNALQMALYEQSDSPLNFLKFAFLCVRLRDKIFYVPEHNRVLAVLRALYFPISSSDYFRYMIHNKKS